MSLVLNQGIKSSRLATKSLHASTKEPTYRAKTRSSQINTYIYLKNPSKLLKKKKISALISPQPQPPLSPIVPQAAVSLSGTGPKCSALCTSFLSPDSAIAQTGNGEK